MKTLFPVLLLAGAMSASPALAGEAAVSPLIGTWAVDVEKLPIPPEARPKSVTITYSDAGSGQWRTLVDVTLPDGKMVRAKSLWAPDGKPVHVVGIPIHWGFKGAARKGFGSNTLGPFVGDANINTPEFKAYLVNIEPADEEVVS